MRTGDDTDSKVKLTIDDAPCLDPACDREPEDWETRQDLTPTMHLHPRYTLAPTTLQKFHCLMKFNDCIYNLRALFQSVHDYGSLQNEIIWMVQNNSDTIFIIGFFRRLDT